MIRRILKQTDKKCLYKFVVNMGFKGVASFRRYEKRLKKGDFFPAFHFISVTDNCNLNCQGCWVTGKKKNHQMSVEQLDSIIVETKQKGSYFFGILGGEPLLYKPLFEVFRKHNDCYFLLFTNGTLLNESTAEELRKCANVTPLISFEGDEQVADIRRGGSNIFQKTNQGINHAVNTGLLTGVAISVCKSNYEMAMSPDFLDDLAKQGVAYIWYYIYRPVGENASPELCLDKEEIEKLHQYIVDARMSSDLIIIDAYWNGEGEGLCPAASGLSHHINASGYIEPCPIIQFATDKVGEKSLTEIYQDSGFLRELREQLPHKTKGCIIMEDPEWLVSVIDKYKAEDTSGRDNERERLLASLKVVSHGSTKPIPEKSKIYKFAKKRAFFGFGAYG